MKTKFFQTKELKIGNILLRTINDIYNYFCMKIRKLMKSF